MRKFLMLAAGAAALTLAVSCTQPTYGPSFPTIALGCHDGGGADVSITGPMNQLQNGALHSTNDGTCGTQVILETFVQAWDKPAADAACATLGGTVASLQPFGQLGYATLGDTVWECSGLH
jgi:hypothetical protein